MTGSSRRTRAPVLSCTPSARFWGQSTCSGPIDCSINRRIELLWNLGDPRECEDFVKRTGIVYNIRTSKDPTSMYSGSHFWFRLAWLRLAQLDARDIRTPVSRSQARLVATHTLLAECRRHDWGHRQ